VISWESVDREDLGNLDNVLDLELLKFEVGIEYTIMELSELGARISSRQVFLLAVINSDVLLHLRGVIGSYGVWNLLEMIPVASSFKSFNKLIEVRRIVQFLSSIGIKMAQIVKELLSEALSLGVAHLWFIEGVVDDLESLPITLSLKNFIHVRSSFTIAVHANPFVIFGEPNFLEINFNFT